MTAPTDPTDMTEPTADAPTADSGSGVSRRAFVVGAGVVAGTAAVVGSVELKRGGASTHSSSAPHLAPQPIEHGPLDALAESHAPRLSIGYVVGSSGMSSLSAALKEKGARSVPASQLRTGSLSLSGHAVQMRTVGLTPHAQDTLARRGDAVLLDVLIHGPGDDQLLPFFAWSYSPGPAAVPSAPVSFRIAAARSHRCGMRVETRTPSSEKAGAARVETGAALAAAVQAASASAGSATQVLTSGFGRGLAKLRTGLYLVGLDHGHWDSAHALPDLHSHEWAKHPSLVISVAPAHQ